MHMCTYIYAGRISAKMLVCNVSEASSPPFFHRIVTVYMVDDELLK